MIITISKYEINLVKLYLGTQKHVTVTMLQTAMCWIVINHDYTGLYYDLSCVTQLFINLNIMQLVNLMPFYTGFYWTLNIHSAMSLGTDSTRCYHVNMDQGFRWYWQENITVVVQFTRLHIHGKKTSNSTMSQRSSTRLRSGHCGGFGVNNFEILLESCPYGNTVGSSY